MITRGALLVAVGVTALVLDTVVLADLTVAGVAPSVATISVIGIAYADGPGAGMRFGFGVGLATDLLGDGLVGISALVLLLVGYVIGVVRRYWSGAELLGHLLAGVVGATGAALGEVGLAMMFEQTDLEVAAAAVQAGVAGLFGLLLAPLVMPPVVKLSGWFAQTRAGGFRARD